MTWIVVVGLVLIVALLLAPRVASGLAYGRLFAAPHLSELAERAIRSREAALAAVVAGEAEEEDPAKALERGAAFVTKEGIGMMYSIAERAGSFEHHLSMSARQRPLPRAAAATLLAFVRRALSIEGALHAAKGDGGVVHCVTRMSAAEHETFRARTPVAPNGQESTRLLAEALGGPERAAMLQMLMR